MCRQSISTRKGKPQPAVPLEQKTSTLVREHFAAPTQSVAKLCGATGRCPCPRPSRSVLREKRQENSLWEGLAYLQALVRAFGKEAIFIAQTLTRKDKNRYIFGREHSADPVHLGAPSRDVCRHTGHPLQLSPTSKDGHQQCRWKQSEFLLHRERSSIGAGCSRSWRCPHAWRCLRGAWVWQ